MTNLLKGFLRIKNSTNFFLGLVNGAVDVLPGASFLKSCQTNISYTQTNYIRMVKLLNFSSDSKNYPDGFQAIRFILYGAS